MSECNFYHGRGKQGRSCRGCGTYIPPLETTSVSEFTDTERLDWLLNESFWLDLPFDVEPTREAIDSEMRREEESRG